MSCRRLQTTDYRLQTQTASNSREMIYTHDTQHRFVVYILAHCLHYAHQSFSSATTASFGTAQDAGAELSWLVGLIMITLVCQEKGFPSIRLDSYPFKKVHTSKIAFGSIR